MRRRLHVVRLRLAALVAIGAAVGIAAVPMGSDASRQPMQAKLTPTADTYVRADRPAASFGRAATLIAGGRPRTTAYLRFEVVVPDGETVTRATLRLVATRRSAAGTVTVRHVASAQWTESSTTYASAPATGRAAAAGRVRRGGGPVSVDVTSLVRNGGPVDVALRSVSPAPLVFASREAGTGWPRLVVQTSAAGSVPAGPCGSVSAPPRRVDHVIWIWMENKAYGDVIGSPAAPFVNGLAKRCGVATDYHGVTHPSLPNYIAATSGSTHGISDDDSPAAHPLGGPSIYSLLGKAGRTWRDYAESSPGPCPTFSTGTYAVRHDPATYYTGIRSDCRQWAIPMGTTARGSFLSDLRAGTLPAFAFVTPNTCSDTHDCPVATGDAWLAAWFDEILASPAYRSGRTVVFLTWDEDDGTTTNRVPLVVVAPSVRPGTEAGGRLDHYALLKSTQQLLGLTPLLGHAGDPGTPSLLPAFNLG
jgi:phosphatidylinositol-3-phosphatase